MNFEFGSIRERKELKCNTTSISQENEEENDLWLTVYVTFLCLCVVEIIGNGYIS